MKKIPRTPIKPLSPANMVADLMPGTTVTPKRTNGANGKTKEKTASNGFGSKKSAPVIQINAEKTGSPEKSKDGKALNGVAGCRIRVSDNGIGFDPKYADEIFMVFKRFHSYHEFEGSGVGLAICKKIVERHGRTITAQSAPGKGSTFTISLPATHLVY